jgi:hypothetical protein
MTNNVDSQCDHDRDRFFPQVFLEKGSTNTETNDVHVDGLFFSRHQEGLTKNLRDYLTK